MLQLPAVNTPQFEVVRNRLDGHPQPVPPIYQPEVIARAVLRAVDRPRREMWIGWSTGQLGWIAVGLVVFVGTEMKGPVIPPTIHCP